jgi:hypothetical protein
MFFAWDGLGAVLFSAGTTSRILTALVESSDDGMIRRLRLEHFHVWLVGLGVFAGAVVSVWASTFVSARNSAIDSKRCAFRTSVR